MKRLLHSVRLRLTLWYAFVLALALAVFALSVYLFVVRTLQTGIDQALQSYGHQASHAAVPDARGKKLVTAPISVIGYLNLYERGSQKVLKHGKTVTDSRLLRVARIALHNRHESCGTLPSSVGTATRKTPERYCIVLPKSKGPVPVRATVVGVEVVESLSGVDKTLERLRLALLLGIPFVLLLTGAGGWILAGRALEPVDHIRKMARSISATDLSRRINLNRQDELGRLAGTFDEMIDRLERAFQEQRQLTADVSHELRSPLTILEAQTTLALRRSRSRDEYQQVLSSVQEEVEHMSTMVNQLLTLARADAGEEPMQIEPISLRAVVEPVVEGVQPLAEEKGVSLTLSTGADLWVHGDAERLHQVVINLLDNALRHTPPGGRVDITLEQVENRAILTVRDTGDGIAPEDLPHVFQRFYRGDRARYRGTGNSGLGLAIVKWIVEAHGGDVGVSSSPGAGATFTVRLLPVPAALPELLAAY